MRRIRELGLELKRVKIPKISPGRRRKEVRGVVEEVVEEVVEKVLREEEEVARIKSEFGNSDVVIKFGL